jgi:hypothetical protein
MGIGGHCLDDLGKGERLTAARGCNRWCEVD